MNLPMGFFFKCVLLSGQQLVTQHFPHEPQCAGAEEPGERQSWSETFLGETAPPKTECHRLLHPKAAVFLCRSLEIRTLQASPGCHIS